MKEKNRQSIIVRTSCLGIVANILIAAVKIVIGAAAGSLAVMTEGINNASDALTSVLTLVGAKLSARHPDRKHPFGYGRVEYLTTLVVSLLICYTGITLLIESVKGIIHPEAMTASWLMIGVIAFSALAKLVLGVYTIKMGEKAESATLKAVGLDCRNDSVFSVLTILVALVYMFFRFSLDAWAGALFSLVVLKNGVDTLKGTVSQLLGQPGDHDLAVTIYNEIRHTPGVLNAADMTLHNYGPDNYTGSVNVQIDHEQSIGDIYAVLHALQLRIMHEYHVTMVFGIYAVDNDHDDVRLMRRQIGSYVKEHEHILNFHALYLEPNSGKIYVDLVVDYDLRDWNALRQDFTTYMKKLYPDSPLALTIETEYV